MINWCNQNAGFISVLLFIATLLFGWFSGLFKSVIRKPKFKIHLLPGPSFVTTFNLDKKHEGYEVHKTALALYVRITNIGNAPASIQSISVAYHWNITTLNLLWVRYRLFWFWLTQQAVIMEDFSYSFGENVKIYPFLFQKSCLLPSASDNLYLKEGQNTNGVVYFEQDESYGGCFPYPKKKQTKIKVAIIDSYGRKHIKKFLIPIVPFDEAKKYNPSLGKTFFHLKNAQKNNGEK